MSSADRNKEGVSHTPGRWKYMPGSHSVYAVGENGQASRAVCVVTGARKIADPARDGNGLLIAAAPTMLAALEEVGSMVKVINPEHGNYWSCPVCRHDGDGHRPECVIGNAIADARGWHG